MTDLIKVLPNEKALILINNLKIASEKFFIFKNIMLRAFFDNWVEVCIVFMEIDYEKFINFFASKISEIHSIYGVEMNDFETNIPIFEAFPALRKLSFGESIIKTFLISNILDKKISKKEKKKLMDKYSPLDKQLKELFNGLSDRCLHRALETLETI